MELQPQMPFFFFWGCTDHKQISTTTGQVPVLGTARALAHGWSHCARTTEESGQPQPKTTSKKKRKKKKRERKKRKKKEERADWVLD